MITRLRAENFKSWKDTGELRLAPLTGLFGTNSSGKTSVLQILLMLRQTVDSLDRNTVLNLGGDNSFVRLGSFQDLIYGHSEGVVLKISLSFDSPGRGVVFKDTGDQIHSFTFDASFLEREHRTMVSEFGYCFDSKTLGMRAIPNGQYELLADRSAVARELPEPVKFYGFPPDTNIPSRDAAYGNVLSLLLEHNLQDIRYLGPLRQYPLRNYLWAGQPPFGVGVDGGGAISALLAARLLNRSIDARIAQWLKEMNLIYSFHVVPIAENRQDYEVRVRTTPSSAEVLLPDVGFGVSQILPVLVLCYYVPEGSTVILEQPEIHLHPSAQSDLADVLIDVVKTRKLQIIMESHSEHLLRRLQRRIAEGALPAEDTALYFCKMDNGASKAEELKIGDDGLVKNWPKDFFGDEMGEVAALTEAAMKRHIIQTK